MSDRPPLRLSDWLTLGALRQPAVRLAARRAVFAVARLALRLRSRPLPPLDLSAPTLVLAPHPDDAELGCGALLAKLRDAGARVAVIYITDGAASHPGHPTLSPSALSGQRVVEARLALTALGVDPAEAIFLNAPDGTLAHLTAAQAAALTARLAAAIAALTPAQIFLPWRHDGSSEHEAVFRLFAVARRTAAPTAHVFEFPIWACWNPFLLRRAFRPGVQIWRSAAAPALDRKRAAIAAHRSQVDACPPWTDPVLPRGFASFFLHGTEYFFVSAHE